MCFVAWLSPGRCETKRNSVSCWAFLNYSPFYITLSTELKRPSKASSCWTIRALCNCFGEPCSGGYHPSKSSYAPAETVWAKLGKDVRLFSSASLDSDSKAGRRIDAYLLGTASGRIFSCRVLEIASGLLSLRVKAKDFMHAYFRKVNSEVLMQLSLQQTLCS